jgi:hypothetical protein
MSRVVIACVLLALPAVAPAAAPPCDVLEEFEIGTDEGPILLPVTIAGKQYPFLLDTGCAHYGYDRSLKNLMGKEVEKRTLRTPAGPVETAFFLPPDARLGSLPLPADKPAMLDDLCRYRDALGMEFFGVLGMDFLEQFGLRIDFERGKLMILRRAPAGSGTAVPIRVENGTPLVAGDVLGVGPHEVFIIDTGCVGFSSGNVCSQVYDALVERGRIEPVGEGTSETAGGLLEERGGVLDRLAVGPLECRGMVMLCGKDWSCLGLHFWARRRVRAEERPPRRLRGEGRLLWAVGVRPRGPADGRRGRRGQPGGECRVARR